MLNPSLRHSSIAVALVLLAGAATAQGTGTGTTTGTGAGAGAGTGTTTGTGAGPVTGTGAGQATGNTTGGMTGGATGAVNRATSTMNNTAMPGNGAMRGGSSIAHVDAAFMKQAAQNNSTEIEASQLALTKASSAGVKTYAQQMIDDHTKTGDEMKALAASKGLQVVDKPSVAQAAKIKMLSGMSGANFDKRYAEIVGVAAHKDTVKLFQKESTNGKDADVKAWATKTLPSLQHHLDMAQGLRSNTASKA